MNLSYTLFIFDYWFILVNLVVIAKSEVNGENNKIKLSQLKSIKLYKNNYTTSKRLEANLQLQCKSSSFMCRAYGPNVVECTNIAYLENNVRWDCSAELDKRVRFANLKVTCEGYDTANDDYILAGSCGLEYNLELVNFSHDFYNNKDLYETNKISNFLTLMIMAIVVLTVYKSCIKNRQLAARRDFNETYAQIISDNSIETGSMNIFPPPPPSYTSSIHNTSKVDDDKQENNSRYTDQRRVISVPVIQPINISRRSDSPPPAYPNDTYICTAYADTVRR
ncbi:unnamed protein product [Brachionus calyciflorus]|uniref:Store-operated calcium entry-associated regulatory factor n=1 Tax=Brachionus calyciflorus TaxID=104777 RepID=A0A813Z4N4_9BILA|nr:unnamed protein product [Brachionus calyciflorus]